MSYISFSKYHDLARLLLRLVVAAVFIYHGQMKLGMFHAAPETMAPTMVLIMKTLAIAEPLAGIALILGLLTQVASLGLVVVMASVLVQRIPTGAAFGKWEFELVLLVASVVIILIGPGRYSLDHLIKNRKK